MGLKLFNCVKKWDIGFKAFREIKFKIVMVIRVLFDLIFVYTNEWSLLQAVWVLK